MKISFISLGCDKNLVDSEVMLGLLRDKGYTLINDETEADVIVVNTCGFIQDAKEESIGTIIEMGQYKENGKCKALIVTGCLAQRYQDELIKEMPEIDAILGVSNYDKVIEAVESVLDNKKYVAFEDNDHVPEEYINRVISSTGYSAYLKIAEGCDNHCTYCIIPKIRGKIKSRTMESLIEETKYLAQNGVKELILVAQDTTKYGIDIYGEKKLPALLRELCRVDGIEWIRLLYCYPEEITDELIEVMRDEEKVLNYLDMPIQHANNDILRRMARKGTKEMITDAISKLRKAIPDICLRTTLITGFPGETREQFEDMKEFVQDVRFDRLGVFSYSPEEGTPAALFEDQIDDDIKEARKDEIMALQQGISKSINEELVGKTYSVIIEGYMPEDRVYCGRTYRDAPDVDGMIFVSCPYELMSGDIINVRVSSSNEYDLIGEIINEYSE
ncbi:30S ribosomal protein S12 methylthiotransferase RimO [Vallitalea guaymasensis]|uniref:Ribosomal protein uS12 methylthiotransferase RimO n=1 Tax=Vallitalea guaymasensis TaxID=1185412 RepID=A0A8J8MGF6_9FIRM|nr:30S ribosomal protein S12 methylthiotransferase RimO [Vallitalea guaymasensis]QUH32120.1 30S ribosomal protein S12 methylthiotransferase RimO [Vallitalea guaymasensis]